MGNVVQCCHFLSNYFKCGDASAPPAAERSPLLSSDEETRSNSPSLRDDTEDDMLTLSTDLTNPALEPEHFLFPDLILSSSLGADAAVVEPMVCLLVSEEEEVQRGDQRDDTVRRRGLYSEVETQTENETHVLKSGQIQTQVEVETQTERLVESPKIQEKEKDTVITFDILVNSLEKHKEMTKHLEDAATDVKVVELSFEKDIQTNQGIIETQEEIIGSCSNNVISTKLSRNSIEVNTLQIQNNMELIMEQSGEEKGNLEVEDNSEEKSWKLDCSDEEILDKLVTNIDSECVEYSLSIKEAPETLGSDQIEECVFSKNGKSVESPSQKGAEDHGLPLVADLDTALLHGENVSLTETNQMTLFLVDELFLEAPHIKAPFPQTEEGQSEGMKEQSIEEIVDLQEMNFTVKIQPPGAVIFEIQVCAQMLVAELHQVLMDHELTCHRTCFSLQLGGAVLGSLTELRSIQGLQEGEVIKVVEGTN